MRHIFKFLRQLTCKHDFGEEVEECHRIKKKNSDGHPTIMGKIRDLGGEGTFGYLSCVKCDFLASFCKPIDKEEPQ